MIGFPGGLFFTLFYQQGTGFEKPFDVFVAQEEIGPFFGIPKFGIVGGEAGVHHGPEDVAAFVQPVIAEKSFEYADGVLYFVIIQEHHLIEHLFSFQKDGHTIDFKG
jgi:hypothetical protein